MLYTIGTKKELSTLPCQLPDRVYSELLRGTAILDAEYGEERDWLRVGGGSILLENIEDIPHLKNYVNFENHPPEWVTKISNTGYASALFVMDDDRSIVVYMPITILPITLLKDLED